MVAKQAEAHRTQHIGWLRAAVLGANDGIVSVSSLIVGVAAASPSPGAILIAGAAGQKVMIKNGFIVGGGTAAGFANAIITAANTNGSVHVADVHCQYCSARGLLRHRFAG